MVNMIQASLCSNKELQTSMSSTQTMLDQTLDGCESQPCNIAISSLVNRTGGWDVKTERQQTICPHFKVLT